MKMSSYRSFLFHALQTAWINAYDKPLDLGAVDHLSNASLSLLIEEVEAVSENAAAPTHGKGWALVADRG